MPGLIKVHHLTGASSTKAGEGGDFCKYIDGDKVAEERLPPFLLPNAAVILSSVPPSQIVKVQSAIRLKQVTDPLGETVRARLYGDVAFTERMSSNCSSSGSEEYPSSVCLAAMVNEFMESESSVGQCGRARCNCHRGNAGADECSNCEIDDPDFGMGSEIVQGFEGLVRSSNDSEAMLLTDVMQAVGSIAGGMSDMSVGDAGNPTHGFLNRTVIKGLRRVGYNAAICKSRWDQSCGIPPGGYEYIDVLGLRNCNRLIVDIDFRAQFEIARPTVDYSTVWQLVPPIFVGKPERLQRIINFMSESAKRSLKLRGLHLPPWRKPSYLKAKWFSSYRRTLNDLTRSHREGDCVETGKLAGIVASGQGLDARGSNEVEMLYHDGDSTFLMKNVSGKREDMADRNGLAQRISEGLLCNANKCPNSRDEITVVATEWQPPAITPRSTQKAGKVIGLASALIQAGLAESQNTAAKGKEGLARVT